MLRIFLHATHTTPAHWLEHYAEAIVLGIGIVGLISVVIAVYWLQRRGGEGQEAGGEMPG